jgi:hypothetical protein
MFFFDRVTDAFLLEISLAIGSFQNCQALQPRSTNSKRLRIVTAGDFS